MSILDRRIIILALALLTAGLLVAAGCQGDDDDDDDNDDASDDDTADDDDTAGDDDDDDQPGPSTEDCEPYGYGDPPVIVRGPYLQHVTKNTIRILWQTDRPANSIIRFGLEEEMGFFQCDLVPTDYHEVEVNLLSAETAYHYLVRSDGAQSIPFSFATAPDGVAPFSFAVYGDNRTQPAEHQAIVDGIDSQLPDLVVNVGDVVTNGWNQSQYDSEFFGQTGALMSRVPMYVSIGNHEAEAPFYYQYFSFPNNEQWYSFDYGNARFIMLNTNRFYVSGTEQYNWFEAELQRAQTEQVEWLFVSSHHPAYSEGWVGYEGEKKIREHLLPLMETYGVDIFFNGHTHDYERGELNGVVHVLTGGGGGPLDPWARDFEHITVFNACYHYVMVEINGDSAQITAIDQTGSEIDSFTMD